MIINKQEKNQYSCHIFAYICCKKNCLFSSLELFPPLTKLETYRWSSETDFMSVFQVFNEVVVDRGQSPYLSNIDLYVEGRLVTTVQGDGEFTKDPYHTHS
jgi:hypothetical protein